MNIIIVCYPTYGGSGVLATELGNSLAKKGHKIHFVTYEQPVRLIEYCSNIFFHEVTVPPYPLFNFPPYEVALASKLVETIIHHEIDLIHVHYAIPHATAAYLAQQMVWQKYKKHIPFVTTLHGTDITIVGRNKSYGPAVSFSINNSNWVTAVSENLKNETYKNFEILKNISVIYNFVDNNKFNNKPNLDLRASFAADQQKIIVHASNFRKVKRVQDVVKVFEIVSKKADLILLMVGDGPERKDAEDLVYELNLSSRVFFLGKQNKIENIFNISDIFLLPSEYESFGLSALEAMASNNAVVSSNAGGLPEINTHNKTGFCVEVGNVVAMANSILYLLEDNNRLNQFKREAKKQSEKFDHTLIIPQYEQVYNNLISH